MEKKVLFNDKYVGYHTFGLELNNSVGAGYQVSNDEPEGEAVGKETNPKPATPNPSPIEEKNNK